MDGQSRPIHITTGANPPFSAPRAIRMSHMSNRAANRMPYRTFPFPQCRLFSRAPCRSHKYRGWGSGSSIRIRMGGRHGIIAVAIAMAGARYMR